MVMTVSFLITVHLVTDLHFRTHGYGLRQGNFEKGPAMKEDTRAKRKDDIIACAYKLLEQNGYAGMSMLKVSKEAKASNETLYRWFGDKNGLFRHMIAQNSDEIRRSLASYADQENATAHAVLSGVSDALLRMILGERAIALNRAAAADPSGVLGRAIAEGGRAAIAPLLEGVLQRYWSQKRPDSVFSRQITETYISLLVGDMQVRRVIGVLPEPTATNIAARVDASIQALDSLTFAVSKT